MVGTPVSQRTRRLTSFLGPENTGVTAGQHSEAFSHLADKTHFAGYRIPTGSVWQARGERLHSSIHDPFGLTHVLQDQILQSVIQTAKAAIEPYENSPIGPPDPSFILRLPNEVFTGSTLYAVQKIFDGPFQFDVFFESASAKQKLTCQYFRFFGDGRAH